MEEQRDGTLPLFIYLSKTAGLQAAQAELTTLHRAVGQVEVVVLSGKNAKGQRKETQLLLLRNSNLWRRELFWNRVMKPPAIKVNRSTWYVSAALSHPVAERRTTSLLEATVLPRFGVADVSFCWQRSESVHVLRCPASKPSSQHRAQRTVAAAAKTHAQTSDIRPHGWKPFPSIWKKEQWVRPFKWLTSKGSVQQQVNASKGNHRPFSFRPRTFSSCYLTQPGHKFSQFSVYLCENFLSRQTFSTWMELCNRLK